MRKGQEQRHLLFFLSGFLIGIFYVFFDGTGKQGDTDYFSVQNLIQIAHTDIVYKEYLVFLLKQRCSVLLLLILAAVALPGKYLLYGFLMLFGCSMGSMLAILTGRYSIKGMFLFLGLIFPQDIIYIPVVFWWVFLLAGWNEGLFFRGSGIHKNKYEKSHYFLSIVALMGVTITGILLECYVNPWIVKWCLKIF